MTKKMLLIYTIIIILCIAVPWYSYDAFINNNDEFTDDFNYNTSFINLKNHPIIAINDATGEQIIFSNSDYYGMFK